MEIEAQTPASLVREVGVATWEVDTQVRATVALAVQAAAMLAGVEKVAEELGAVAMVVGVAAVVQ